MIDSNTLHKITVKLTDLQFKGLTFYQPWYYIHNLV